MSDSLVGVPGIDAEGRGNNGIRFFRAVTMNVWCVRNRSLVLH